MLIREQDNAPPQRGLQGSSRWAHQFVEIPPSIRSVCSTWIQFQTSVDKLFLDRASQREDTVSSHDPKRTRIVHRRGFISSFLRPKHSPPSVDMCPTFFSFPIQIRKTPRFHAAKPQNGRKRQDSHAPPLPENASALSRAQYHWEGKPKDSELRARKDSELGLRPKGVQMMF